MRLFRTLLIAGGVTLGVAGAALAAAAAQPVHIQTVTLPNGMVAHIRYTGAAAPRLVMTPVNLVPVNEVAMADPFAAFDRMAAEMDAQSDAMMRQVAAMQAQAVAQMRMAATGGAPAGAPGDITMTSNMPAGSVVHYSFVSSANGATCSQSVQVTSAGGSAKPQVISNQSGDCSKMGLARPTPAVAPAPPVAPAAPLPVSAPKPATPAVVPANTI